MASDGASTRDQVTEAGDSLTKDADSGKSSLVWTQGDQIEFFRARGQSSIPKEFGEPLSLISEPASDTSADGKKTGKQGAADSRSPGSVETGFKGFSEKIADVHSTKGADGVAEGVGDTARKIIDSLNKVVADTTKAEDGKFLKDLPSAAVVDSFRQPPVVHDSRHMHDLLRINGLEPPNLSPTEKAQLRQEHDKLDKELKDELAQYEKTNKECNEKNRPLEQESVRLSGRRGELDNEVQKKATEAASAATELKVDLKEAGVDSGGDLPNPNDPASYKTVREAIDKQVSDPLTRDHLKNELDIAERKDKELEEAQKRSKENEDNLRKVQEQIDKNNEPRKQQEEHITETRKALAKCDEKIAESKFGDDLKEIDKLPKEKREAVYKAMEQIANNDGGPPNHLSPAERQKLVEQVAHQIAHPESIQQGNKGTCGLAATEFELAKAHPEKYAQYVADLATNGEAKTPDGRTLKINPEMINVRNDWGGCEPHDDGNPERSLASKIFQTACANRVLEDQALAKGEKPSTYDDQMPGTKYGRPDFTEKRSKIADFYPSVDTGERIIGPDGTVKPWTGVNHNDLSKLSSELTGEKYESKPILKGRDLDDPKQEAAVEREFISEIRKNGLPVKVSIQMKPDDFTGMGNEGGHEVVITKVVPGPPALVYFDNTAGGTDHNYPTGKPVPLKEFLKAMKSPDGSEDAEGHIITKVA